MKYFAAAVFFTATPAGAQSNAEVCDMIKEMIYEQIYLDAAQTTLVESYTYSISAHAPEAASLTNELRSAYARKNQEQIDARNASLEGFIGICD